jgi:hypothetical protein
VPTRKPAPCRRTAEARRAAPCPWRAPVVVEATRRATRGATL